MAAPAAARQLWLPLRKLRGAHQARPARHTGPELQGAGRGRCTALLTPSAASHKRTTDPCCWQALVTSHFKGQCCFCKELGSEGGTSRVGRIEAIEPVTGVLIPFFVFLQKNEWHVSMWSPVDIGAVRMHFTLLAHSCLLACLLTFTLSCRHRDVQKRAPAAAEPVVCVRACA